MQQHNHLHGHFDLITPFIIKSITDGGDCFDLVESGRDTIWEGLLPHVLSTYQNCPNDWDIKSNLIHLVCDQLSETIRPIMLDFLSADDSGIEYPDGVHIGLIHSLMYFDPTVNHDALYADRSLIWPEVTRVKKVLDTVGDSGFPQRSQRINDKRRLLNAFLNLRSQRIISLHQAGTTQADAISDIIEVWDSEGGEDSGVTGYCFYTLQDWTRAESGDGLLIGFGHPSGKTETEIEIGKRVSIALKDSGFDSEWNQEAGTRINIPNFSTS